MPETQQFPDVTRRLLEYISYDTASVERKPDEEPRHPSSQGQEVLLTKVMHEMKTLGVDDDWIMVLPDKSFLVTIPATPGLGKAPHICLAAHVDTYPGVPGKVDNPMIHQYEGGDIQLPEGDVVIPASDLEGLEGSRILSSNGTTLLGGDDKAGLAVIMTALDQMLNHNSIHGPVTIWVCVDEEIGELGFGHLDKDIVDGWDVFLTVDGGRLGPIDVGCFYCRIFQMIFEGSDAHPGEYPDKLKPSHYAAMEFAMEMADDWCLPDAGIRDKSSSFFYVTNIEGRASRTVVNMAPRSFDRNESDDMVAHATKMAERIAENWGCRVKVTRDIMATVNNFDIIDPQRYLLEPLTQAHVEAGLTVTEAMVRGGTDGSMLNVDYPNLVTPNMGYGGMNLHGYMECVVLDELERTPNILLDALRRYAAMELPTAS